MADESKRFISRVPGSAEAKLALLRNLDEASFPYLVGDILFHVLGHKDIRILDGPGDGRRDIQSIDPQGHKHVTQCKFHRDPSHSVGARETDELVIALAKFNLKNGLFATTGSLSPQAKREYIDNFKEYRLDYLDGTQLIDAVLSDAVLSAAWLEGSEVTHVRHVLAVPFIVRDVADDQSVRLEFEEVRLEPNLLLRFKFDGASVDDFRPYRAPSRKDRDWEGPGHIWCLHAVFSGAVYLHNLPDLSNRLSSILQNVLAPKARTFIVRYGMPFMTSLVDEERPAWRRHEPATLEDKKFGPKVPLESFEPQSYVMLGDEILPEKEWILPSGDSEWRFPEGFGTLESVWACWYNPVIDTCMRIHMYVPPDSLPNWVNAMVRERDEEGFGMSLFAIGRTRGCRKLEENIADDDAPDWRCSYGAGSKMLAWFDPAVARHAEGGIHREEPEERLSIEEQRKQFLVKKERLRALLELNELEIIQWSRARQIAAAADRDLLPEIGDTEFDPATLVHYYEDMPSPANLNRRICLFVQMWEIPDTLGHARRAVLRHKFGLPQGVELHRQVRLGPKTKKTFAMFSLEFKCPIEQSADQFLAGVSSTRDQILAEVRDFLKSKWSEATLATGLFWEVEVGLKL